MTGSATPDRSRNPWASAALAWALLLAGGLMPPAVAKAPAGPQGAEREELLWQHRNLGKAFYENTATQYEAVGEFKKALELAPDSARERVNFGLALLRSGKVEEGVAELEKAQKQDASIPHTWFNLGIAYKQLSRYSDAIRQLEGMVQRVPGEAISHYNLGVLYKLQGQTEKALAAFEKAAALDGNLAGPHFQLATAYRQLGRAQDAQRQMDRFRELKKLQAGAALPEDLEWSWYSEIYEVLATKASRPRPGESLAFEIAELDSGRIGGVRGLVVVDADGDGGPDLLAYGERGVQLLAGGSRPVPSGLEALAGLEGLFPGDWDNDGRIDLCALKAGKARLLRNGGGRFEAAGEPLPGEGYRLAVWLDYDHDYDLDLFLLGATSRLLRNGGSAGFSDQTAAFPFADGVAVAATVVDTLADSQQADLAILYRSRPPVIYRDRLAGRYEAEAWPAGPANVAVGAPAVEAQDLDYDGWTDLLVAGNRGLEIFLNDGQGSYLKGRIWAPRKGGAAGDAYVIADLENRGAPDLVTGQGVFALAETKARPLAGVAGAKALAAADFDGDGLVDLVGLTADGGLRQLRNRTSRGHHWLKVGLTGVKNLKLAPSAEVEVKAGPRFQKKIYQGLPLHFGLGQDRQIDTVRITWPNGLIQNESRQAADGLRVFEEAQRLSGSCPMIFTWNGEEFQFITDVLGVAPLGASAGDGQYFPVDHDEIIQIPGEALVPRDGSYEIRITEELREVAFLDEIRLIAVDHPAQLEIFTNDKFKAPPFPEFRLFGVRRPIPPRSARDGEGRDVLDRLVALDERYADGFRRDYAGVAELHSLELDFGDAAAAGQAVLILTGWVDWADGSTFLGASQENPQGLTLPYLQVRDERGQWRTVIEDMGIPAGKPKTIAVDLTGKFLSASREIRIVTNLCLYWDHIFLSEDVAPPPARLTEVHAATAELRFRGFSQVVVHPQRLQPERFLYSQVRPTSMWNPTRGLYTRYGDVEPLLTAVDDRFVILGSGDELRLLFPAAALPPLPQGSRRDFLLFVDGWAKDGDANTAHSQTVGPLPYHGMPQYPYQEPDAYPQDGAHRLYNEHYNRRPALRLIRPLAEGAGEAGDPRPTLGHEGSNDGSPEGLLGEE